MVPRGKDNVQTSLFWNHCTLPPYPEADNLAACVIRGRTQTPAHPPSGKGRKRGRGAGRCKSLPALWSFFQQRFLRSSALESLVMCWIACTLQTAVTYKARWRSEPWATMRAPGCSCITTACSSLPPQFVGGPLLVSWLGLQPPTLEVQLFYTEGTWHCAAAKDPRMWLHGRYGRSWAKASLLDPPQKPPSTQHNFPWPAVHPTLLLVSCSWAATQDWGLICVKHCGKAFNNALMWFMEARQLHSRALLTRNTVHAECSSHTMHPARQI